MALWGKADDIYSPGSVTVNYENKTITGTGTSFTSASEGDVISIGTGKTFGSAVISGITSNTVISIASTDTLNGEAISAVSVYTISQMPKYALLDSNYTDAQIFGADSNIEVDANTGTQYALTHAGWVGIKTYVDTDGNLRVKTETLVAMSGISTGTADYINTATATDYEDIVTAAGDAADDATLQDVKITINTQPSNAVGVATTTLTFTVAAISDPPGNASALSYLWQVSTNSGTSWSDLSNGGDYSNTTTATVSVANTNAVKNGYQYRVLLSATGARIVASNAATLGVTTV
jgi:hypothetical protein